MVELKLYTSWLRFVEYEKSNHFQMISTNFYISSTKSMERDMLCCASNIGHLKNKECIEYAKILM